jgi:hypothetical protein
MENLKDQLAAQVVKTRQVKPEFMQEVDRLIAEARDAGLEARAIKTGQTAPDFQLPDAHGQAVALKDLLQ